MEQGENFKREGLPALQQVYYLMELERLGKNGKKRGSVTRIAKTCGVHRSSVNRYFKKCLEEGYLTEGLDLTEKGKNGWENTGSLSEDSGCIFRKWAWTKQKQRVTSGS